MRWYSPFDWILGPETQEEIEELQRLKNNAEKASEEPSTSVTGMKLSDNVIGQSQESFNNENAQRVPSAGKHSLGSNCSMGTGNRQ